MIVSCCDAFIDETDQNPSAIYSAKRSRINGASCC
jgi:hypothetical protein